MRVGLFDPWASATSWAARLQSEGCDVLLYHGDEDPVRRVGDGIVTKEASYDRLVSWAKESPEDTVLLFCASDYGEKADELRRAGLKVIGAGSFADKLERDRQFGQQVAESIGIATPKFMAYTSVSEAIADWRGRRSSEGGVFKSDTFLESDATQVCMNAADMVMYLEHVRERFRDRVKFIIQELVGGKGSSDFDVNRWWDGNEFVGPYGFTMEKKAFLTGDLGPSTGCAVTAFWWAEEHQFVEDVHFDDLTEFFRSVEAPPCVYAINCRISDDDGKPYFLEWTPRLGFDSETTAALLVDDLSAFLWRIATGEGGTGISYDLAYSVRLSVPPYPYERVEAGDRRGAEGVPIPHDGDLFTPPLIGYHLAATDNGYEVASAKGVVGLAAAVGDNLGKMGDDVLEFVNDLHSSVSKLQARTDGVKVIQEDAKKLEALGYDVHEAILKGADDGD